MTEQEIERYLLSEYARWDWSLIPSHMWGGVKNWVEYGISGGGFQRCIMEHDFYEAIGHADHMNKASIVGWAEFLSWYLPSGCHGSYVKCQEWAQSGGLRKILANEVAA